MRRRYVMGTFLSVHITGENSEGLCGIFLDEVQWLEGLLSRFRPESEISRINGAAGRETIHVSEETYEVIEKSLHYARLSNGAFDPTVQPIMPSPPNASVGGPSLRASMDPPPATAGDDDKRADYHEVHLDPVDRTVFLTASGMRLDLGGMGKGFALDKALARVREAGKPESVSADFGGQLLFWHAGGLPAPETIVIENPESRGAATTFQMSANGSVSTSSNVERANHLIDPRSGRPAREVPSVTVVAPTATEAEAFSTTLFVLGAAKGQALVQTQPGVRVFFT